MKGQDALTGLPLAMGSSADRVWRKLAANTNYLIRITAINDSLVINYYGDFTEA